MKKFLLIIPLFVLAWSFIPGLRGTTSTANTLLPMALDSNIVITPEEIHEKKAALVAKLVTSGHYKKMTLDDSLSSIMFDNYIEELDENKLYFLASDMERFEKYRYLLDDELSLPSSNLNIAYNILNTYLTRINERLERNDQLLQQNFDFTKEEYYETDRDKVDWMKDEQALDEAWHKLLKSQILQSKLSGEVYDSIIVKLQKRYKRYQKTLSQTNAEDVFQTYMNAFSEAFDPHTAYFSPISADNFNNNMKRSLEGIGAVLGTENDYTIIRSVREGGPAFKSKSLFKDDRIIGVAQGDDGEMVDVVGWRLDEVIQLIRGKKGTVVRLSILSASEGTAAKPTVVRMIREKITFEEQSSTKQIIHYQRNGKDYKVGVIGIPAFYINFEEYRAGKPDYKSTTNDVKKILAELREEQVDGLIIDLRYNGGGSLKEAIDLTSLFIEEGPVVQVKDGLGRVSVGETGDFEQAYTGPLVVMVNRFSASASEIFSGAIQDYQRGIIVGEETYGKGTVQSILDLGRYMTEYGQNIGQLNLTLSKYYRVTGSSTQHLGVVPDLKLPSPFEGDEYREKSQPSALPWDEISSARFRKSGDVSNGELKEINQRFAQRMKTDEDLKKLLDDIKKARDKRNDTRLSLNEAERKKENEADKAEEEETQEDTTNTEQKTIEEYTDLKDLYLKNGVQVVADLVMLS
ncbi:MAG: carboxy terminal-processing peptidase [Thermonemataceae bacterium]